MDIEDYKERQQEKLNRYLELADKAKDESASAYNRAGAISDMIPFGQPVLVGHHSEGRHRRDIERIHNAMNKSIEAGKKAEYYKQKAGNVENPNAISSDDPEAIDKLKEKLAVLEAAQIKRKAVNAAHARFLKNPASLDNETFNDEVKERIRTYIPRYSWEPHPIPPYAITNDNANIKRIKDRIAHLESIKAVPEIDEIINGVRVFIDKYENRIKVIFPDIPSEAIRSELKHNGFRWSPRAGAWQAYINQWNLDTARRITKGPEPTQNQEGSE
jgi:hypothetical protein